MSAAEAETLQQIAYVVLGAYVAGLWIGYGVIKWKERRRG